MCAQACAEEVAASESPRAFELRGLVSSLAVVRLQTTDLRQIDAQLVNQADEVPAFFRNAPVVIDVGSLPEEESTVAFSPLVQLLRQHDLIPVAVIGADERQQQGAQRAGLGLLDAGVVKLRPPRPPAKLSPLAAETGETDAETEPVAPVAPIEQSMHLPSGGMLLRSPVRSGQVIYAPHTDIIALAQINRGAELIAGGNIHCYAPLRGRALAGATGNTQARIFCSTLDAELVSICGHYLRADEIPDDQRGKPVQIFLEHNELRIGSL